jgi:hypothetical protein
MIRATASGKAATIIKVDETRWCRGKQLVQIR